MSAIDRWLPSHGRLWYGDPWYRAAWLVLPQAVVLGVIGLVWLSPSRLPGEAPWGKPQPDAPADNRKTPPLAPPLAPPDPLVACRSGDAGARVAACTVALNSGTLPGDTMAEAYFDRADALTNQGKWVDSLDDYNRAITLAPTVPRYYNDRGVALRETNAPDKAMQDFNKAVALDPNYALGYANRCNILYVQQRYLEALEQCNVAISKNGELIWAYSRRAGVYESLGNWKLMFDDGNRLI